MKHRNKGRFGSSHAWLAPVFAGLLLVGCGDSSPTSDAENAEDEIETPAPEPTPAPAPAPAPRPVAPPAPPPSATCAECGRISSIQQVREQAEGSGAGAIIGAVAGGVLGSQIGSGRGRKLATVIGAAGGAYGGHQAEKNIRADTFYRVSIQMDEGGTRTIDVADASALSVGQPVRVFGENIQLR
jgi:outer membrane lipoprotein SlyB